MYITLTQTVKIDAWLRLPFKQRKHKCPFHHKSDFGHYRECYSLCATAFPKIAVIYGIFPHAKKRMLIGDCPCNRHTPKYVTERVRLKLKGQ